MAAIKLIYTFCRAVYNFDDLICIQFMMTETYIMSSGAYEINFAFSLRIHLCDLCGYGKAF